MDSRWQARSVKPVITPISAVLIVLVVVVPFYLGGALRLSVSLSPLPAVRAGQGGLPFGAARGKIGTD